LLAVSRFSSGLLHVKAREKLALALACYLALVLACYLALVTVG